MAGEPSQGDREQKISRSPDGVQTARVRVQQFRRIAKMKNLLKNEQSRVVKALRGIQLLSNCQIQLSSDSECCREKSISEKLLVFNRSTSDIQTFKLCVFCCVQKQCLPDERLLLPWQ